jgi:hypothetical protein
MGVRLRGHGNDCENDKHDHAFSWATVYWASNSAMRRWTCLVFTLVHPLFPPHAAIIAQS